MTHNQPPDFDAHIDYPTALRQCLAVQERNIACHRLDNGQTVWVRRATSRNAAWRYRLLGRVAKWLRLGVLTPVPNLGGTAGISTEVARLSALANAGITVPTLLAWQDNALMISHIGEHNLQHEWRHCHQDPIALAERWQLGLSAIAHVHQRGQYLSQAFARNLIYQAEPPRIAFIDFEDDPASVMPLALCQARDWLCYLHSGARIMQEANVTETARQHWLNTLTKQPDAVSKPVFNALQRLRPMARLQAPFWGSDTLRLAAMAAYGNTQPSL